MLDFADNQINDFGEVYLLQKLKYLTTLDLRGNPIREINFYRFLITYTLEQVLELDGEAITGKERVEADVFFGKDVEERKAIFKNILPEEKFIDYRTNDIENVVVHKELLNDVNIENLESFNFSLDHKQL